MKKKKIIDLVIGEETVFPAELPEETKKKIIDDCRQKAAMLLLKTISKHQDRHFLIMYSEGDESDFYTLPTYRKYAARFHLNSIAGFVYEKNDKP